MWHSGRFSLYYTKHLNTLYGTVTDFHYIIRNRHAIAQWFIFAVLYETHKYTIWYSNWFLLYYTKHTVWHSDRFLLYYTKHLNTLYGTVSDFHCTILKYTLWQWLLLTVIIIWNTKMHWMSKCAVFFMLNILVYIVTTKL